MRTEVPTAPRGPALATLDPEDATSTEALRAQAEFTQRRLERRAAELLHELKPSSMIRTRLGGHSRATPPEIGSHMFSKLKKHPVVVSGLVTAATSLLLAGDEARPGRSLRQRLGTMLGGGGGGNDDAAADRPRDEHGRFLPADSAEPPAAVTAPVDAPAAKSVAEFARENPLLVGAGAVAAGLFVGALIPKTRRGMVKLGTVAADGIADKGQAALQAVQEQIEQTGDGSPLVDRAKEVGRATLGTMKEAATGAAVAAVADRLRPGTSNDRPAGEQLREAAAEVGRAGLAAGEAASRDAGLHPESLREAAHSGAASR